MNIFNIKNSPHVSYDTSKHGKHTFPGEFVGSLSVSYCSYWISDTFTMRINKSILYKTYIVLLSYVARGIANYSIVKANLAQKLDKVFYPFIDADCKSSSLCLENQDEVINNA